MKRIWMIMVIILASLQFSIAQYEDVPLPKSLKAITPREEKSDRKIKFLAGGNFGLQFGNYTAVEISPQFGIYPVDWLLVGVGGTYMFSWDSYYKIPCHTFGFNAYLQGYIWKRLILHVGYEYLNYPIFYVDKTMTRHDLHSVVVGAGYRQYVTDRVSVYGLLLFNVYQSSDYYTRDFVPIVRFGVNFDI
ncbi:MAG: hypothetical protein RR034_01945 [Bacteroidales bacterium]